MGDENLIYTLRDYSKLATRARGTPLSPPPKGTMWCLFDPTPSGWCKTDAHSTNFGEEHACVYFNFPFAIKLAIGLNVFQRDPSQHGESLFEAWTRFKDLLLKVPHHGLDLWLQVQIFYDHVDYTTQMAINYAVGGRLRKLSPEVAWETIEDLA
ncbi:hypothetical protein Tco_0871641 [Tanacetum coccineum]